MLINTNSETYSEVAIDALEKRAVTHLGSIEQDAANASEIAQDKSMQRRLRRENRIKRNTPMSLGLWHVSMW